MENLRYHMRLAASCYFDTHWILPNKVMPILANIKLTENCNSKCITCDYWRTKHHDYISANRAIDLLTELKDMRVHNLRFTGGEPLTRKDFFEILRTQKPGDFSRVVLATNGLLLNRFHEEINKSIITNITVSLDAVGENNDIIRGIKGYYDNAINGLNKLENKKIKIVSTLTNLLVDDLNKIISFCKEKKYDYDINLPSNQLPFLNSKDVNNTLNNLWPSQEEISKIIQTLSKNEIVKKSMLNKIESYMLDKKIKIKHCMLGYLEINIDSKGDVRPGCYILKPIGNILNGNLCDIVNQINYKEFATKMYHMQCTSCTCGYTISDVYNDPFGNFRYIFKMLHKIKKP